MAAFVSDSLTSSCEKSQAFECCQSWPVSSSAFIQCWRCKIPWKKKLHFSEPGRGQGGNELWDEASEGLYT